MSATLKESLTTALEEQNQNIESGTGENANKENQSQQAGNKTNKESTTEQSEIDVDDKDSKGEEAQNKDSEYIPSEEIENALKFYNALRDPAQAQDIIRELALRSGLIKENENLTKSETKNILETVNEVLGEEYSDLKDKLGPLFKSLEDSHKLELNKLRHEIHEKELATAREQFSVEFDEFLTDNKITESDASKMLKEIEALPPNPNNKISLKSYLGKIHKLINSETISNKNSIDRIKKIQDNNSERPRALSSDVNENRIKRGSQNPSIREAIEAAQRGESFD